MAFERNVCGLETIFVARHNGQGPDGSLKRWLIRIHLDSFVHVVALDKGAQST